MSFTNQIAELTKAKAKIAQQEAKLAADRVAALSKLPTDYGYASLNEFIKALKDADGKGPKAKSKTSKGVKPAKAVKAPGAAKAVKGKRAKITAEVKAEVKALVEAGKTGQEIAKALGISQPSVQNIKKELGLVKARPVTSVAESSEPVGSAESAPVVA